MKFTSRFREWCPETGKKADLMFVQHMLASLKGNGHMATIMPHGVLFRGGKERLIRELLIKDDVIEAIISLPQGLFYGTGIPACVLVCNKKKPDDLRGKVFFINADREFAEGKNQNKLRPEDMEKIDFVFSSKREIPKYSRLVEKSEIADTHDYNLNIRRYVDNTPEPEPEDVQAHLIGGIPKLRFRPKVTTSPSLAFNAKRYSGRTDRDTLHSGRPLQAGPTSKGSLKRTNRSYRRWIPTAMPSSNGGAQPVMTSPSLSAPITAVGKCRMCGMSF